ncbi:Hypothetical predicted protein [Octopus vulgaris]|uniref:Secreted protein n=1 Tax=Octopus vulgaris TaxID=6645 RepID=A0AA36B5G6_OCTVU|nr:Hypothetical predicted protein [Octopus vulgaris]
MQIGVRLNKSILLVNILLKSLKCKNVCISAFYNLCIAAAYFIRSHENRIHYSHELCLEFLNKIFKQHQNS